MGKKRVRNLKRGRVYYCDFGEDNIRGSEQRGTRPVIIISNDVGNRFSPTVIVAAITSQVNKTCLPTHVILEDYPELTDEHGTVLLEQIRTVDKSRLRDFIIELSPEDMQLVDQAILASFFFNNHTIDI